MKYVGKSNKRSKLVFPFESILYFLNIYSNILSLEIFYWHKHMRMLSRFSCVQLFATLWTVARQAPLSMGLSRQEYWTGWSCPPPEDLLYSGIETASCMSPALAGGFFTTSATWETLIIL